jgi:hypothetical protein
MTLRKKVEKVEEGDGTASVFEEVATSVTTQEVVLTAPLEGVATPIPSRPRKNLKRKADPMEGGETCKRIRDVTSGVREGSVKEVTGIIEKDDKVLFKESPLIAKSVDEETRVIAVTPLVPKIVPNFGEGFTIKVRPVLGEAFQVTLPGDANVYDLRDAVFAKSGLAPNMQLLGHPSLKLHLEEEERFLDELGVPHQCTLQLGVRASAGLQVLNACPLDFEDGEDFFVYDVLADQPVGGGDESDESDEDKIKRAVSIPVPPQVLQSYLRQAVMGGDVRKGIFEELEALRISVVGSGDDDAIEGSAVISVPERPATPAPLFVGARGGGGIIGIPATFVEVGGGTVGESLDPKSSMPTVEQTEPSMEGPVRCKQCQVRCRLAAQFTCKCGGVFCRAHRFPDLHRCEFDHQSHDRERLARQNQRVTASKL